MTSTRSADVAPHRGRSVNPARDHPATLTLEERLDLEMNDEDNAARVLSSYGADLVFVAGKGWAVWDGTRYSFRSGNLAAREIGHRLRQLVLEEAEFARTGMPVTAWQIDSAISAAMTGRPPRMMTRDEAVTAVRASRWAHLHAHSVKCGNVAKVKTTLEVCEHQRRAEVEDMDNDPWRLTLPNGDLDLRAVLAWEDRDGPVREVLAQKAAWLRPVERTHLPTKCAGVPFEPGAEAPEWENFMDLILPEASIRACVQRCLGAALLGENRAQVCILFRGPGGNGKSTLLSVFAHVMGRKDGYAAPCKIEMFLETGIANASSATPEESDLPGARVYIATEPGARDVLSAKKIKGLTGGDRRMSRGLYADPFFWTPTGIPFLSCNRTPKIKDEDEGTRRRLIFIPFDVNLRALPPELQRSQSEVEAQLRAEGSGILNWLIAGFRDFMARGIASPEPMLRLKDQLLEAADPVGVFLAETTVADIDGRLNVTEFYRAHERWAEIEGRTLYQAKTVGDIMVEKGFERGKVRGLSCWKGLRWSDAGAALVADLAAGGAFGGGGGGTARSPPPRAPMLEDEPPF